MVNEAAEITPERVALIVMVSLGLPFGNAAVGYAANTALPGGLNVQNARGGLKLWSTNYDMVQFNDIVIVIKGGMTQDEFDGLPIPPNAGLDGGGAWPPAAPTNLPSGTDILAFIDEYAGHFGTEKQSVIGCEIALTMTKGFPAPGVFGTGGDEAYKTIASRSARDVAMAAETAARAAHTAAVAAYDAALAALPDAIARAAAIANDAVQTGNAIEPPHPGTYVPQAIPALAGPAAGAAAENIPNTLDGRQLVDVLLRQQNISVPRCNWSGTFDAIGRLEDAINSSAAASRAFTGAWRIADTEEQMLQLLLANDAYAYAMQVAMRECGAPAGWIAPGDAAATQNNADPYHVGPPVPMGVLETDQRAEATVRTAATAVSHSFTKLGMAFVKALQTRTNYMASPVLATQVGFNANGLSGFNAPSCYGMTDREDMLVFMYNEEVSCVKLPHAGFGVFGLSADEMDKEYALQAGTKKHVFYWSDASRQRGTLLVKPQSRTYNKGFCESVIGQRTQSAVLLANQHGLINRRMVELVLQALTTEDDEPEVVRPPHARNIFGGRQGKAGGSDVSMGRHGKPQVVEH